MISQLLRRDLEWPLYRIAKSWGWLLALGIATLLFGVAALGWPHQTLLVMADLFALQLIIAGLLRFAGALAVPRDSGWLRAMMATQALISFFAGMFLLRHPVLSIIVLALAVGAYWMVHGFLELFDAVGEAELQGRNWMMLGGILSFIAGGIVFFGPHISLLALTWTIGIWLVVYGAILIVMAFQVWRSTLHPAEAFIPAAP
jgi:uncharacterized membrane protein HdeD (DUF308 family)